MTEFWRFFSAVLLVRVAAEAVRAQLEPTERVLLLERGAQAERRCPDPTHPDRLPGLAWLTEATRRPCLLLKIFFAVLRDI